MTKVGECSSPVFEQGTTVALHITDQWLTVPCQGCKNCPCINVSFISSIKKKKRAFSAPFISQLARHACKLKFRIYRRIFLPPPLMASFLSLCLVLWSSCESDDCFLAINPAWLWHYAVKLVAETFLCVKKEIFLV